jgi:hypothetical protein
MTKDAKGGWRVTMDVISTERPYLRYGPDRILVSAKALPRALKIGDGLSGLVHLRPQSGPMRSGNYDFAFLQLLSRHRRQRVSTWKGGYRAHGCCYRIHHDDIDDDCKYQAATDPAHRAKHQRRTGRHRSVADHGLARRH